MSADPDEASPTGEHYFDESPNSRFEPKSIPLVLPDLTTTLQSARGVFSAEHIDVGTKLLLSGGPELLPDSKTLVDVGCGYGAIAVTLAHRVPDGSIWAVDVNERAIELASANLEPYPNARAVLAVDFPVDTEVDEVWSNPPIRIGKPKLHALLQTWHGRLKPGGRMVLVVQKHLGADSLARWCTEQGWPAKRFRANARFRILIVGKP